MRYMARRVVSGEWLTRDLSLRDVDNTKVLSGPGIITGTVSPEFNRAVWKDGLRVLEDNATLIYAVDDNGKIDNYGVILPPTSYDDATTITVAGLSSYASGTIYTGAKLWGPQLEAAATYDEEGALMSEATQYLPYPDPVALFHEHWAWIQAQPDSGYFNIQTVGPANTGMRADDPREPVVGYGTYEDPYRLAFYEVPDLGSEIDTIAQATPFDYREQAEFDYRDNPVHQIEVGWPRLGARRRDLRFAAGENVPTFPTISTLSAPVNHLIGVGNGDAGPSMAYESMGWFDGRIRRTRVLTDKTLNQSQLHQRLVSQQDTMRGQRIDVTSVVVLDHSNARLSSINVGDDIPLLAEHPEYGDLDVWVRVMGITKGDDDGAAVLSTSLSSLFSYKSSEEFA